MIKGPEEGLKVKCHPLSLRLRWTHVLWSVRLEREKIGAKLAMIALDFTVYAVVHSYTGVPFHRCVLT